MVCTHIAPKKMIGSDMRSMVDLKGIEPSNLTDANRALSQLSYGPVCLAPNRRYNKPFLFICQDS